MAKDDKEVLERLLSSTIENICISFLDEFNKANAELSAEVGLKAYIIREEVFKCCDWCHAVAGKYVYGTEPKDIYRRHDNCKCMVLFKRGKEPYQDVWRKKKYESQKEARIEKINELANKSESNIIVIGKDGVEAPVTGIHNNRILKSKILNEAINSEQPIYAENLRQAYKKYKIEPWNDCYDVVIHGSSYYVEYEEKYLLGVDMLAMIISGRKDWKTRNIRLISCSAGKVGPDGNCIAKQLAKRLGVTVYAADDIVTINPGNKLMIGNSINGVPFEDGCIKFEP